MIKTNNICVKLTTTEEVILNAFLAGKQILCKRPEETAVILTVLKRYGVLNSDLTDINIQKFMNWERVNKHKREVIGDVVIYNNGRVRGERTLGYIVNCVFGKNNPVKTVPYRNLVLSPKEEHRLIKVALFTLREGVVK